MDLASAPPILRLILILLAAGVLWWILRWVLRVAARLFKVGCLALLALVLAVLLVDWLTGHSALGGMLGA
jgi:hypothetical protein